MSDVPVSCLGAFVVGDDADGFAELVDELAPL